jgi:hypothetical protein
MNTNRRWLICAATGVLIAPILYVLIQGVWAFALGDLLGIARGISDPVAQIYLSLHSAIGAVMAAALVGFPLGIFARVSPIFLGFIVSSTVAIYLICITYEPDNYQSLIYLSKELPVFILFSIIFCSIGSKCITGSYNSPELSEK